MIEVGVNVNFKYGNYILFMVVCCYGYEIIVEMLIKVGVDVNDINGDSLFLEIVLDYKNFNFFNNFNIFKILLKVGVDVDCIIRK